MCCRGLFELLEEVGDALREVDVDVDSNLGGGGLGDRCVCTAVELSWKLVVLLSQSCSICVLTSL